MLETWAKIQDEKDFLLNDTTMLVLPAPPLPPDINSLVEEMRPQTRTYIYFLQNIINK